LSVESQRRELEGSTMSAPDQMGKKGLDLFNGAYDKCLRTYYKLIDWGEKPEDARYILPQALNCNMIATFNGRSLRHFIKLRMTKEAQSEIRELATKIYNIVVLKDPYMFEDLKKRSEAE
jgi:thymidylate synthase (FAD)